MHVTWAVKTSSVREQGVSLKRSKTVKGIRRDRRVEVVRSFSYKLNVGNYESRDFFCSQKTECSMEEASDVGILLYTFCKTQVLHAVKEYWNELNGQREARNATPPPVPKELVVAGGSDMVDNAIDQHQGQRPSVTNQRATDLASAARGAQLREQHPAARANAAAFEQWQNKQRQGAK
jgi:hypothetical protein